MNWHIEHHMFAGVPCYNLKKLHYLVAEDMPEPRTLLGAWREMRETWQRQKTEPDYFFDTPLPSTASVYPYRSTRYPGKFHWRIGTERVKARRL